jgi:hypothetical protein
MTKNFATGLTNSNGYTAVWEGEVKREREGRSEIKSIYTE